MKRSLALASAAAGALVCAAAASAHAQVSPPVVVAKASQVFTLAVPTEKENVTTTKIELTPPEGFSIASFIPTPGWNRSAQQVGSGEHAVIARVTWDGGRVPTGEAAAFAFVGRAAAAKTYAFAVRQTYSDGSVVEWSGKDADAPAPTVAAVRSLGGRDGGSSPLGVIALIMAGIALVLALAGLATGSGRRTLA